MAFDFVLNQCQSSLLGGTECQDYGPFTGLDQCCQGTVERLILRFKYDIDLNHMNNKTNRYLKVGLKSR